MSMIHLRQPQHRWNDLCTYGLAKSSLSHVPFGFFKAFSLCRAECVGTIRGRCSVLVEVRKFRKRTHRKSRGNVVELLSRGERSFGWQTVLGNLQPIKEKIFRWDDRRLPNKKFPKRKVNSSAKDRTLLCRWSDVREHR